MGLFSSKARKNGRGGIIDFFMNNAELDANRAQAEEAQRMITIINERRLAGDLDKITPADMAQIRQQARNAA